jgi:hypothetical protein
MIYEIFLKINSLTVRSQLDLSLTTQLSLYLNRLDLRLSF